MTEKQKFCYLDFLDKPTPENVDIVRKKGNLTYINISKLANVSIDTVKGWFSNPLGKRYLQPNVQIWNLLLCELFARDLGYENLASLLKEFNENSKTA